MKQITTFLLCMAYIGTLQAQINSENSRWQPNKGTIRVLYVFAEVVNDVQTVNEPDWSPGQMPNNPQSYFDAEFTGAGNISGFMTDYFYQSSFGEYIVLGDYVNTLIQVDYSQAARNSYDKVISALHNLPGSDITTARGYTINSGDFDNWSNYSNGLAKNNSSDGNIDFLMIFWRVNSKLSTTTNSGYVSVFPHSQTLKGKSGINDWSEFVSHNSDAHGIMRHEYSHSLYGGNNFHTAGAGAGKRTFMSSVGGYSNMSSWDGNGILWNGWDRHRMGWKNTNNQYLISAIDAGTGQEVNFENYSLANNPGGGEYILRDFVQYGDAIRIKLPHISGSVFNQYLWLENHAESSRFGFSSDRLGMYSYIQIGKDNKSDMYSEYNSTSLGNYLFPLPASGRFDFYYDFGDGRLIQNNNLNNPFTGYHYLMRQGVDINDDGTIASNELFVASKLTVNGNTSNQFTTFGNTTDPFRLSENKKLCIGCNPAAVPVLTYNFNDFSTNFYNNNDNKEVHLNGLSVEILEENVNPGLYGPGAIKIRIRWDDYDISQDTRWCGPIALHEQVQVKAWKTLTLDQGYTPTRHNIPQVINEENVFADITRLRCLSGSEFNLEAHSTVNVKNNSELLIENGAELNIDIFSALKAELNGKIIVKNGGVLTIHGNGKLSAESGGKIIIENGGLVIIQDAGDLVIKESGFLEIESGGRLEIENGGVALIDFRGKMVFHPLAEIEFMGSSSLLEFRGLLELEENAAFKVITQGAARGILRFNFTEDPEALSQHNILTNGNNCQVDLSMTEYEHYRVEIMPFTYVYPKDNLLLFNIDMAVVYMDEDAFFNIGCPLSAVNTYVSKMPGNLLLYCHSGFKIYGQPNVNFDGMRMYHAKNGIRAFQNFGGNNLVVKNSIFRKCKTGIQVYHNGFYIQNNRFFECNLAIDVQMPTIFTIAENNYFSENYGNMIIAGSGGSGLVAAGNIFRNGQFSEISNTSATFLCNSFIKNGIGTLSGYNGSRINMSSTELTLIQTSNGLVVGGKNKFLQNIENFNSYNNSSYNLIDGYNQFVLGTNSFYSIMANKFATPLDRNFNLNTWDPALPTPPSIYPTPSPTPLSLNNTNHFQLTINSSMPYYVQGITTTWDNTCPISDFQDALEEPLNPSIMTDEHQGGTETLLMSGTFTNLPVTFNNYINASELVVGGVFNGIEFETALNTAVNDAYLGQEGMIVRVDRNGLSDLSDLLIHVYDNTSNEDVFQQAYKLYLQLINNAVADSVFHPDSIVSSDYNDAIALIDSLILLTETNNTDTGYAKKKISYLLDKANVYRVFRQYDNCLSVLDEALYFAEDLDLMLVGIWQCFLTKERDAFLDVIDRDSFTVAVEECYNLYTIYHDSLVAQYGTVDTTTNIPIIPFSYTMTPNPVSSTLTANIVVDEDCELSLIILDRFGATKYSTNLGLLTEGNHYHPVDVSAYSSDLYHMIIIGCGHYDSQQFVVVHPAQ